VENLRGFLKPLRFRIENLLDFYGNN